jgi:hypothetical protein
MLLWNNGPRMQALFETLDAAELSPGASGKGRNCWICWGYVLASEQARMVAMHDCDIATYSREMLARLCYPVAHPSLGFDFCKGYYARVSDRLNGRVMRLFFTPLVRALRTIIGHHPYLSYLDSFRYPLAGEIALDIDLVRRVRIPQDWALELGTLSDSELAALVAEARALPGEPAMPAASHQEGTQAHDAPRLPDAAHGPRLTRSPDATPAPEGREPEGGGGPSPQRAGAGPSSHDPLQISPSPKTSFREIP